MRRFIPKVDRLAMALVILVLLYPASYCLLVVRGHSLSRSGATDFWGGPFSFCGIYYGTCPFYQPAYQLHWALSQSSAHWPSCADEYRLRFTRECTVLPTDDNP
jgi:hypothetical protein